MRERLFNYLVSIVHNNQKENMMLQAHNMNEAKEKVFDVVKKSSIWNYKKMIVELYENHTTTAANIVREYGIGSATLYKWVGQYGKIQTPDGELTNNKEIKKLKKELNDLKIENEILKKAMAIFTQK